MRKIDKMVYSLLMYGASDTLMMRKSSYLKRYSKRRIKASIQRCKRIRQIQKTMTFAERFGCSGAITGRRYTLIIADEV